MGLVVDVEGYCGPVLPRQRGVCDANRQINVRMSVDVGNVVGERSQRESVLIEVLRIVEHRQNEVTGADIVCEIAEDVIAEGIVANVLDDAAAVGIGMGFYQVLRRGIGESRQQQWLDLLVPE